MEQTQLVIVHEQGYDLYGCEECTATLSSNLFWGAQYAEAWLQNHAVATDQWLDQLDADGGVLFDPSKKTLIFFGGEIVYDIALRRIFLALMRYLWPNWTIQWAVYGIVDLATYVGVPEQQVITEYDLSWDKRKLTLRPVLSDVIRTLVSIRDHKGAFAFFPIAQTTTEILDYGPACLNFKPANAISAPFNLANLGRFDLPFQGLHADLATKTVTFWQGVPFNWSNYIRQQWHDWQLNFVADQFEEQVRLCAGNLILPEIDLHASINEIYTMLFEESDDTDNVLSFELKTHLWNQATTAWIKHQVKQ